MNDAIEMVNLDMQEFVQIGRGTGNRKYKFPVVSIKDGVCFSNTAADPIIPYHFKWFINADWLVMKECEKGEHGSYKTTRYKGANHKMTRFRIPYALRGANLDGEHKLYKVQGGVAFKKYDIL